jgi:hypothetical protein
MNGKRANARRPVGPCMSPIVGNFYLDKSHTSEVLALIESVANDIAQGDIKLGLTERFGSEGDTPVLLVCTSRL